MLTISEEDIRFLADNYQSDCFDVTKAIGKYYGGNHFKFHRKKWLLTVVSSAIGAAVAFAGGYSLALSIQRGKAEKEEASEQQKLFVETTAAEKLEFEDIPIVDALCALSEAYGCKLSTASTEKRLTASFSREDDLEYVVKLIESALDITIIVER
ncbi:MAG: DUF4974 domain-containing protein [Bacteroidia bacterium]|nr:DUF4974 domain-containing protein [Bacteroidia bacterium]